MADDRTFLHRWSRRKHEAARAAPETPVGAPAPVVAAPLVAAPAAAAAPAPAPAVEPPPLPPLESLTLASDFSPFLAEKVEETVRRAALRKLFSDPHFNMMDGLDVYIDDYSKPDPVPDGLLDRLADAYKTIEEKLAASPPDAAAETTTADAPAPPGEPAPVADRGIDERQG